MKPGPLRSLCTSLILVGSLTANAFTLNSSYESGLQGWANGQVILLVNEANCPAGIDVPAVVMDAVQIWNHVGTSNVKISYGGSTTSTTYASPTTVYCEPNFEAVTGASQVAVPAAASVTTSGAGRISQGLLLLNASAAVGNIANFDPTLLRVILAHEIGHILGLGHSDNPNALMYYNGSYKTQLRLAQDDIDGVSYLYPQDEFSDSKYAGCGIVESKPPDPPLAWGFALVFLLPLLLTRLPMLRRPPSGLKS